MNKSIRNALLTTIAGAVVFALPACAESNEWKLDPMHSKAGFEVKHMMISTVRGDFSKLSGTAQYDGKNVNSIKVDATIDANSISTGNEDRDKHLRNKDFFDTEKFSDIKFVSKSSKAAGKGKFKLAGDLTMHGVTKPVTLDVDGPSEQINDKHGNWKIGASATTKVNRKDFGLSYGGLMDNGGAMVGDEIKIVLDIELSKPVDAKADAAPADKKAGSKKPEAKKDEAAK
ncbi:MAG: YceI family protein [Candidatus Melainabacteria bacterium]|nr:YceI family protein [Candidatus Melainabacteria bacterium]